MYVYEEQKSVIFTEQGQRMFLEIRDRANALLKNAGAFRMLEVFCCGDSWDMMACVDRLVELGEIVELTQTNVAGQYRAFVSA